MTIDDGLRAGATSIPQPAASKPGTPPSAKGAISGADGSRAAEVTPSARALPAFTSGSAGAGSAKQQRYMAADYVGERGCSAFIGHVRHFDPGRGLEHFGI